MILLLRITKLMNNLYKTLVYIHIYTLMLRAVTFLQFCFVMFVSFFGFSFQLKFVNEEIKTFSPMFVNFFFLRCLWFVLRLWAGTQAGR
jgi:hypothetical protein